MTQQQRARATILPSPFSPRQYSVELLFSRVILPSCSLHSPSFSAFAMLAQLSLSLRCHQIPSTTRRIENRHYRCQPCRKKSNWLHSVLWLKYLQVGRSIRCLEGDLLTAWQSTTNVAMRLPNKRNSSLWRHPCRPKRQFAVEP